MTLFLSRKSCISLKALLLFIIVGLGGCGSHVYHVVQRGETLYSIGWIYGYDYREIAQWNGIKSPYALKPGQRLRVSPTTGRFVAPVNDLSENKTGSKNFPQDVSQDTRQSPAPVITVIDDGREENTVKGRTTTQNIPEAAVISNHIPSWQWPTSEKTILQTYSASDPSRQGVDLSGNEGDPVYAAANGYVVYAGSGLVRYGRLIIVKHSEKFLSAYAHNHKLRVKEGEVVKAGQQIAEMGRTGTTQPKLHFEIRRDGKPVDPLSYLPR